MTGGGKRRGVGGRVMRGTKARKARRVGPESERSVAEGRGKPR